MLPIFVLFYRVRKALTAQLHEIRKDLGPKEEKLARTSEKLEEVDREYEVSLKTISKKDQQLEHKATKVQLLQKQVKSMCGRVISHAEGNESQLRCTVKHRELKIVL